MRLLVLFACILGTAYALALPSWFNHLIGNDQEAHASYDLPRPDVNQFQARWAVRAINGTIPGTGTIPGPTAGPTAVAAANAVPTQQADVPLAPRIPRQRAYEPVIRPYQ